MQAAEARVDAGLAGTGLTVRMRAVLEILHQYGDQTVPQIAERLDIKRQYVQIMCNETLASGFVGQRANPRHKRSPILSLTDHGRTLIEDIISREMTLMDDIGAMLSSQDIATALRVVMTVMDRLKNQTGGSA